MAATSSSGPAQTLARLWQDYYNLHLASESNNSVEELEKVKTEIDTRIGHFLNRFDHVPIADRFSINMQAWMRLYLRGDTVRHGSNRLKTSKTFDFTSAVYHQNQCARPRFPDYTTDLFDIVSLFDDKGISVADVRRNYEFIKGLPKRWFFELSITTLALYTYYSKYRRGPSSKSICLDYAFEGSCHGHCKYLHICLHCAVLRPVTRRCDHVSEKLEKFEAVTKEKIQRCEELIAADCMSSSPLVFDNPRLNQAEKDCIKNMRLPLSFTPEFLKKHDLLINIKDWLDEWECDPRNELYVFISDKDDTYSLVERETERIAYSLERDTVLPGQMTPFRLSERDSPDIFKMILGTRKLLPAPSTSKRLRCPTRFHLDKFTKRMAKRPFSDGRNFEKSAHTLDREQTLARGYNLDTIPDVGPIFFDYHNRGMDGLVMMVDAVKALPEYQQYIQDRGTYQFRAMQRSKK